MARDVPPAATRRPALGRREGTAQQVLLVVACVGARCAALRGLDSANPGRARVAGRPRPDRRPESDVALRRAVQRRRDAVLVSVPCLGPCHQGSVAAVGTGIADGGLIRWLTSPTVLSRTELPERSAALVAWIDDAAPDPADLPEPLR